MNKFSVSNPYVTTQYALENMVISRAQDGEEIMVMNNYDLEIHRYYEKDIFDQVMKQNPRLANELHADTGRSNKFLNDLADEIKDAVTEKDGDVTSIAFQFEGNPLKFTGLIAPDGTEKPSHYRWYEK